MSTTYIISNVPNVGPYEREWNTLEAAERYMEERGYAYVDSMPCDHPSEEARYYVHASDIEEAGLSVDGVELNGDLLDKVYGYGYEPTITPAED